MPRVPLEIDMTKNSARKRVARQIQAESGMPYTAALKYTDAYQSRRFHRSMWGDAIPQNDSLREHRFGSASVHSVGYLLHMGPATEDFFLPGALESLPFPVGPHARIVPWRDERYPEGYSRAFRLVWSDQPLPEDLTVIDPWF